MVRVARADTPVDMGPPLGRESYPQGGLVLDFFLGTAWHAETGETLDAVQALIVQGDIDPLAVREISWTLWEITPFFCPDCGLNYCSKDWDTYVLVDEGFYDCSMGICPNGHRHTLDD